MAKDDEKTLRQLSLLSFLLEAGRPVTAHEVMESVEGYAEMTEQAFKKRFFEDREDLRDTGLVIKRVTDPRMGTGEAYYLSPDDYRLPDIHLTADEYATLFSTLFVLQDHFPYQKPLRLALVAIGQAGGRGFPMSRPGYLNRILLGDALEDTEGIRGRLAALQAALRARKTVRFDYAGVRSGDIETRTVDPYGLYLVSGHWYVVGRDHLREAIRMFRLDRMHGQVMYTSKKPHDFTVPQDYNPEYFRARPPWLLGGRVGAASVRVAGELAWWVTRTYGRWADAHLETEDGAEFTFPYTDPEPLLDWVVTWRRHVRLLGPEELLDRLRAGLATTIALHEDTHARVDGQVQKSAQARA